MLKIKYQEKEPSTKGLGKLEKLFLGTVCRGNKISEIEDLDELKNLNVLTLDFNEIMEIKGLKNLEKLEYLRILGNKIPSDLITELGGLIYQFQSKEPLNFVKYC
ncbi:MAG: hypothetical protein ACFFAN_11615 [Promethearchaeota archaeon]